MKKVCMIVQDPNTKGGIAAVVNGYRGSELEKKYNVKYVESYKDGSKIQKLFKALKGYLEFAVLLAKDKPDIIHIHSSFGPSFYRKLPYIYMASAVHIPIINHIHGSEFAKFYINASKRKQKLVQSVWGRCAKFIVLSDEWRNTFSVVIPMEKMQVIENYSKLITGIKRENKKRVIFLGMINEMKGCYDIVDVVKEVCKKIPDVKMVMCGVGNIEQMKEKAKALGVLDNFEFTGWIVASKKDAELRDANLLFLPSYSEGMPMSILDAMGYGLPIVASDVGGIPKIVRNNGYLHAPGDVAGFAESIVDLLNDEQNLQQRGEESWRIVREEYSLDAHIHKLEEIYEEF